jgi:uncharacterized membrane protein YdjX (TVP38/TMEM64 family)
MLSCPLHGVVVVMSCVGIKFCPVVYLWVQDQIAALGPWGGALFVLTVMLAEMVPLFPTQPLTLASGLLFGPVKVSKAVGSELADVAQPPPGALQAAVAAVAVSSLK